MVYCHQCRSDQYHVQAPAGSGTNSYQQGDSMAKMYESSKPWKFLDEYRGTLFTGEWPTLPEMFDITVKRYPENRCFTAFSPEKIELTYREAHEAITGVANFLAKAGAKKGDRIVVTGKNSPEWAIAYLAVLYAGCVVVPLDYQLKPKDMDALMDHSDAKIAFVDEELFNEVGTHVTLAKKVSLSKHKKPYILDVRDHEPHGNAKSEELDLAAILYTSGTTGNPKGVMLTHRNITSDCFLAQALMTLYPTDVFYVLLPIHHSYTMLAVFIEGISVGSELVFGKKLVVSQIFKDLKEGNVTMFLGVPMLFNKLIKGVMGGIREKGIVIYGIIRGLMGISGFIKKTFKVNPGKKMFGGILKKISLDTNRICISGGGPLPTSTFRMFNQLGIDFVQGYGLTEASPILTLNPVTAYRESSVGLPLPQVEVRILEPDDRGIGEITVRGPMVMWGYYKNKEDTDEILDKDGWLRTGDVGYQDRDGYLYLTGRKKSLIVTEGGKNVFPEEIEELFQLYEEIDQILVMGYELDKKEKSEGIQALAYPSETFMERMKQSFQGDELDVQVEKRINEIIGEVNKSLLPYKRISRVHVLKEPMEMTTTKKIKRFKYAQEYK